MLSKEDIIPKNVTKHRQSIYLITDIDHIEIPTSIDMILVVSFLIAAFVIPLIILVIMSVKKRKGKWVLRKSTKSLNCWRKCPRKEKSIQPTQNGGSNAKINMDLSVDSESHQL